MRSVREEHFEEGETTYAKALRQMTMASERGLEEAMCLG